MLATKVTLNTLLKKNVPVNVSRAATYSSGGFFDERYPIGKREWVGYGINGHPNYQDRPDYPAPAVRFREITGELAKLWCSFILAPNVKITNSSGKNTLLTEGKDFYGSRPSLAQSALALREKEKKDWKNLTIEEKKKLYRASFCQTLVEADAPTGQWKSILGFTLGFISIGLAIFILQKEFIYRPKPHTFTEEYRAASLGKMIDLKVGHLTGISSKWDYEKNDWKQ